VTRRSDVAVTMVPTILHDHEERASQQPENLIVGSRFVAVVDLAWFTSTWNRSGNAYWWKKIINPGP
jgi:hypothetical protein